MRQRLRVARVDLDPEDVEGLDGPRDLEEAFRLEVEIEVHEDVHVRPGALAEGRELIAQGLQHGTLRVQLRNIPGPRRAKPGECK